MEKKEIRLQKRTAGERQSYLEGYHAAIANGATVAAFYEHHSAKWERVTDLVVDYVEADGTARTHFEHRSRCTHCKKTNLTYEPRFCPNCGYMMDGVEGSWGAKK